MGELDIESLGGQALTELGKNKGKNKRHDKLIKVAGVVDDIKDEDDDDVDMAIKSVHNASQSGFDA